MRKLLSIAVVCVATVPVAAFAKDPPATPPAQQGVVVTAAPAKKDRMICETAAETGSRFKGKKVCRTATEWAEQKALDRRDVERMQANRYNGNQ